MSYFLVSPQESVTIAEAIKRAVLEPDKYFREPQTGEYFLSKYGTVVEFAGHHVAGPDRRRVIMSRNDTQDS